jgi:hypothetical protein
VLASMQLDKDAGDASARGKPRSPLPAHAAAAIQRQMAHKNARLSTAPITTSWTRVDVGQVSLGSVGASCSFRISAASRMQSGQM